MGRGAGSPATRRRASGKNAARLSPRRRAPSASDQGAAAKRGRYARGVERKRHLLDTVLALVARDGVAAVTHRAVADEAGVSLRATTYYFDTKQEMIREALRHYVQANIDRADEAARAFPTEGSRLDAAVDTIAWVMLEELRDPEAHLPAEYELILAIAREPSYAPEYEELQRMLELRLEALLAVIGSESPPEHARLVLAATRGLQIEQLARPGSPPSERTLKSLIRTLVRALVPASEAPLTS